MGARQSKRSVDISGKEAEGGEVAGAGGEGRVERIADADAPNKPQLNGEAPHIEPQPEITEKEKILENGTSEKEESITEKEAEGKDKEIILSPVNGTNGEENGDAKAQEAENNKKNKKEKIKKKWSFRSISFSKKDKQKPEKKQKEETNGDCEKVAEEAIDATPTAEKVKANASDDTSKDNEVSKEGQTPETPVTEPITNGSSAPETPKEEAAEAPPAPSTVEVPAPAEEKATPEPENLPINGLSINDPADDVKETAPLPAKAAEPVESVKEEVVAAPVVDAPASEAPVATEVCVTKPKVEETAPPPLPANPPPSSLTAFATTTMAPHLVDESVVDQLHIEPSLLASSQPPKEPSCDSSDKIKSEVNTVISQPEKDLTDPIVSQLTSVESVTDVKDTNTEIVDFEAPELSVLDVSQKILDSDVNILVESTKDDKITNISDTVLSDIVAPVEGVENTSSVISSIKTEIELTSDLISNKCKEESLKGDPIPVREENILSADVVSLDILVQPPISVSNEASAENSIWDDVASISIGTNPTPLISETSRDLALPPPSEISNEAIQSNEVIEDKFVEPAVSSININSNDCSVDSVPVLSNSPLLEPLEDNVDNVIVVKEVVSEQVSNINQNIDLNIKGLETEAFVATSIDSPTIDLNPPSLLDNCDSGSFPPLLESEENAPPTSEDFRSSLLDNAVSETDISDSFPPPPPPESCASESATELSVSESLPPPNAGSPVPESPQHSAQEPLEADAEAPTEKRPLHSAQPSQVNST